jgi:cobalt-zinc-cadmium efflux system protein
MNPAHSHPGHARAHSGGGHLHVHGATDDVRRLAAALALIGSLMGVELVAGVLAHSLALLSDAGHMLTDAAALGLAIAAARLARRPARGAMTFGLGRAEILSAQANGATLLVLALLIAYSSVRHLISPPHVHAWPVILVAIGGVLVSGAATLVLSGANRANLNVEGSFRHILTDMYAFLGTLAAGVVIELSGFERADAIAALVVAALMAHSGAGLLKAAGRVVLEAAPPRLDPELIGHAMAAQDGVVEVHDLHVWEVSSSLCAVSAHVLVAAETDCHAVRRRLETVLHDRFHLEHTTLQIDHACKELLALEVSPRLRGETH